MLRRDRPCSRCILPPVPLLVLSGDKLFLIQLRIAELLDKAELGIVSGTLHCNEEHTELQGQVREGDPLWLVEPLLLLSAAA